VTDSSCPDPSPIDPVAWFRERLPAEWMAQGIEVMADSDEVLVVLTPDLDPGAPAVTERFRAASRDRRMEVAAAAEEAFGARVSWGMRLGDTLALFTTASVPVMTRLRLPERRVLDTLIDAGVARSRSDALAWCVRLVGSNEDEWIAELRRAFRQVAEVRGKGPRSTRRPPAPG
jgi:hypothetical protein